MTAINRQRLYLLLCIAVICGGIGVSVYRTGTVKGALYSNTSVYAQGAAARAYMGQGDVSTTASELRQAPTHPRDAVTRCRELQGQPVMTWFRNDWAIAYCILPRLATAP